MLDQNLIFSLDIIDKDGNLIKKAPIGAYTKNISHNGNSLEEYLNTLAKASGLDQTIALKNTVENNKVVLTLQIDDKEVSTEFSPNDVESWAEIVGRPEIMPGTGASSLILKPQGSNTNEASATYAIALGANVKAQAYASFALGTSCQAKGEGSIAVGGSSIASGKNSSAIGFQVEAKGLYSHAQGQNTKAIGDASCAEGYRTEASAWTAHAEGEDTKASGQRAHAEGRGTQAQGQASHAGGLYTIADKDYQTVIGKYNEVSSEKNYAFIIGNGSAEASRSNAFTVDWDGNLQIQGSLTIGAAPLTETSLQSLLNNNYTLNAGNNITFGYDEENKIITINSLATGGSGESGTSITYSLGYSNNLLTLSGTDGTVSSVNVLDFAVITQEEIDALFE